MTSLQSQLSSWTKSESMMEEFPLSPYSDQMGDTWEMDEEQPILGKSSDTGPSLPSWKTRRSDRKHNRRQSRARRSRFSRVIKWSCGTLVAIIALITLFSLSCEGFLLLLTERRNLEFFPKRPPSTFSSWITYGVNPVSCHSHNDYWRHIPLWSALTAGCTSVEADIWPEGDELRVGHSRRTILRGHSLRTLYLNPLEKMLDQHNQPLPGHPVPENTTHVSLEARNSAAHSGDLAGVFANDPTQTLVLLVDFKKEDAEKSWSLLVEQLNPLRQKGYLTHFNGEHVMNRPLTIVATGDAPFHHILQNTTYRDIFCDAPVNKLTQGSELDGQPDGFLYNSENSYYASGDLKKAIGTLSTGRMSPKQRSMLRDQVREAHERGLKVRYWGTPNWPVGFRNYVWRALMHEGADVLNVDDLYGATREDWRSHRWW